MDDRADEETKPEETTCSRHENIKAIGTCRVCGRPICPLCLPQSVPENVPESGDDTCSDCYRPGKIPSPPPVKKPWLPFIGGLQADRSELPSQTRKRPIGITLLAAFQFLEAFIMLKPMVEQNEVVPIIFFGMKFESYWAAFFQAVLIIASILIGIGFIKAWYKSWILYLIFAFISIANNLVLILVPRAMNLFISTIPEAIQDSSEETLKMYPVIIIFIQSALLWYVFRQKKYFEQKG